MVKAVLTCAMMFSLPGAKTPSRSLDALPFQQVAESKNLSQLVRSNAPVFWDYSREVSNLKGLEKYIQEEGLISGDAHVGNYSVIPVKTADGRLVLRFLNIDFDDAGRGSFALEFANFVAMAKADSRELKVQKMLEAYVAGLRGESLAKPKSIAKSEQMPLGEFEVLRAKYVDKKRDGQKFKLKAGEIEAWSGRPNLTDIAPLFTDSKVLDVARRPLDRGGSLESLRLWVLTQEKDSSYRIFELKEYQESALSFYTPQAGMLERTQALKEMYWPGIDGQAYTLVSVQGRNFWLREKKVEILTYKDVAAENEARLYVVNLMGQLQGSQAMGRQYLEKIEKDPVQFKEAVKTFVNEYLHLANTNLQSR